MDDSLETAVSTVGRLWPGVTGRIQDLTTGRVLGPGQAGELCIKSYGVMKGYYNNPEETEKAVDRELASHRGYCLSVRGRASDPEGKMQGFNHTGRREYKPQGNRRFYTQL